ncbi:MAG: hypothetical protein Tsb0010_10850 [Parvularculaceae bacterium]
MRFSRCIAALGGVLALLVTPAAAAADEALPPLLEQAIAAGETIPETRWIVTQRVRQRDRDGADEIVLRFDPSTEGDSQIEVAEPQGDLTKQQEKLLDGYKSQLAAAREDGTENISASYLMYDGVREMLRNGVEMVSEDAETAIYAFAPSAEEGDTDSEKFLKHIRGELTVAKAAPHIRRMRLFALEPFKPAAVAKLESFEQIVEFAPPTADRPPLMTRSYSNAAGSAFFKKFENETEVTILDIRAIN